MKTHTLKEKNKFYILDVFAEKKFSGNQLAVVTVNNALSDSDMQQIAREFNFSETTFILSDKTHNGCYPVRIFTPKEEVPFAGHPTLGAAYVIQKEIRKEKTEEIILNLKVGQILVRLDYKGKKIDRLTMKQKGPIFGKELDREVVSKVLSLHETDIDDRFPVQEVSTGLPFIIAPIKTLNAVKKARIIENAYFALIEDSEAKALYIFCPETYREKNHLNARMFADAYGIPEDPATGSAAGCLAGYLLEHQYFGQHHINVRVEQGYEINRPSLLFLEARRINRGIEIYVGGKVLEFCRGTF